jgi:hypothetical protein
MVTRDMIGHATLDNVVPLDHGIEFLRHFVEHGLFSIGTQGKRVAEITTHI